MTSRAIHHTQSAARVAAGVLVLCIAIVVNVSGDHGASLASASSAEAKGAAPDAAHLAMASHAPSHGESVNPCDEPCDPERCPPDGCVVACASLGTSIGVVASLPGLMPHGVTARPVRPPEADPALALASSPPYRPPIV